MPPAPAHLPAAHDRVPTAMVDQGYDPYDLDDIEAWLARPDLIRELVQEHGVVPMLANKLRLNARLRSRPSLSSQNGRGLWLERCLAPLAVFVSSSELLFNAYCWTGERRTQPVVVRWLARSPAALKRGPLLVALAQHPSVGVYRILLRRLEGELLHVVAQRAAEEAPGFLLRAVREEPALGERVPAVVWATLLGTDARSVRELALTSLPRRVE